MPCLGFRQEETWTSYFDLKLCPRKAAADHQFAGSVLWQFQVGPAQSQPFVLARSGQIGSFEKASGRIPVVRKREATGSLVDLGRSRNQKCRRSVSISTSPARSFLATCVARSTLSRGILRALAAFYPEPKYRTCNPQDRIDSAMGIAMITEVIAQPLDRCDRDPIQLVRSEYRQNMFGESCSKVRDVGGTAVGVALKPILSDLRESRYLSRGMYRPSAAWCAVSVRNRSAALRVLKRRRCRGPREPNDR